MVQITSLDELAEYGGQSIFFIRQIAFRVMVKSDQRDVSEMVWRLTNYGHIFPWQVGRLLHGKIDSCCLRYGRISSGDNVVLTNWRDENNHGPNVRVVAVRHYLPSDDNLSGMFTTQSDVDTRLVLIRLTGRPWLNGSGHVDERFLGRCCGTDEIRKAYGIAKLSGYIPRIEGVAF